MIYESTRSRNYFTLSRKNCLQALEEVHTEHIRAEAAVI